MSDNTWVYDHTYQTTAELTNIFPETNFLLQFCAHQQTAILQFWQSRPTIILGLQDKHLSHLKQGLLLLRQKQYTYFIRNSGGLAVVCDPGVLNVSFFIPPTAAYSIEEAYELAFSYLQRSLPELSLEHYQIDHSYCPGTYDLVVAGKKIGGMAQRRRHQAVVVMLYLSVNGDQLQRGQVLQHFYQIANTAQDATFPTVWPQSMANIQDFFSNAFTVTDCKKRILQTYKQDYPHLQLMSPTELAQQPDFAAIITREKTHQQHLNQILNQEVH